MQELKTAWKRFCIGVCCGGWAGDVKIRWKYELGVRRLQEMGLKVVSAPNALKGSAYLSENPKARAEDIQEFLKWFAGIGALDELNGIIMGKAWHFLISS